MQPRRACRPLYRLALLVFGLQHPSPQMQELQSLTNELSGYKTQHLMAKNGFKRAADLVEALQGGTALAVAILGVSAAKHPSRRVAIATAALGAVSATVSGVSSTCHFAGRAAQNEDAAMYYLDGHNMGKRRLKKFMRQQDIAAYIAASAGVALFMWLRSHAPKGHTATH